MAKIYYARVDEFWRRGQKYAYLDERKHVGNVEWQELKPDAKHNWLTEGMQDEFETFISLGSKEAKAGKASTTIFRLYSAGINTARDTWVYNFNREALVKNIKRIIESYNEQVYKWIHLPDKTTSIDEFTVNDATKISWSEGLKNYLLKGIAVKYKGSIRHALYRPFTDSFLYFDHHLNERRYQLPLIFSSPATELENKAVCLAGVGDRKGFGCLMTNHIPSYDLAFEKTQCFPFYTYDEDGANRRENVTDWALGEFRAWYGDETITKWDIFHYVYAVLHHPVYRERYAANLKRELPRIPYAGDFHSFARAGARLAELHVNYERQPEYPLERVESASEPLNWRVERMRLSKDRGSLVYNSFLTLRGIPPETFEYRLGNRSALEWVIDQYQVTTDKRSGIVNDPNRPEDPQYILRLVGQVITVSLETRQLLRSLPPLFPTT